MTDEDRHHTEGSKSYDPWYDNVNINDKPEYPWHQNMRKLYERIRYDLF